MSLVTSQAVSEALRNKNRLLLHPKQFEVFQNPSRFKIVVAGRRWGKTFLSRTALIKAASKPKQIVWYVAPSYRMAKQIMWYDLRDAIPRKWVRNVNETTLTIFLVNGSRIELRGADKPDALRGVGLNYLVLDEFQDMKPDVWDKVLRPTLARTRAHALFIGTPKQFNHLHELWVRGQDKANRLSLEYWSWQFPTITSPFIPADEIEQARRDMDEKSFRQEFLASFESMSGRVYYEFDRSIHVGNYPFNPDLPIWIGQDFNVDPMSSAVMQKQPNGEVWIVDEIVLKGSNTTETCDEIERRYWRYMKNIVMYPDPAGSYRQSARGESDLDIFRDRGLKRMKYHSKHPPIADRVNAVNKMLKSAQGDIRLRVNKPCKEVIESLEQTIYKPGTRDVDKDAGVEHVSDAIGYCIEYEFPVRKIEILGYSR